MARALDSISTALCVRVFAALGMALLAACGGGSDDDSSCTVTPAPAISSGPPGLATAGQQYQYRVEYTMACFFFFNVCGLDLLQGPPGAGVDEIRDAVYWTPSAADVGTTVQFTLATKPDPCGNRATQSWLVRVQ